MRIACLTNKEVRVALNQLEKKGYKWASGDKPTGLYNSYDRMIIVVHENAKKLYMGDNYKDTVRTSKLYKNLLR